MSPNIGLSTVLYHLEIHSLAIYLLVGSIQRFYGICRINNLPYCRRKLKNRANSIPVVLPAFHGIRIFWCPFLVYSVQYFQCFFLVCRLINGLSIYCKCFLVLVWNIFQCVSDLMDNAALVFCFGECRCNGFFDSS